MQIPKLSNTGAIVTAVYQTSGTQTIVNNPGANFGYTIIYEISPVAMASGSGTGWQARIPLNGYYWMFVQSSNTVAATAGQWVRTSILVNGTIIATSSTYPTGGINMTWNCGRVVKCAAGDIVTVTGSSNGGFTACNSGDQLVIQLLNTY